MSSVSLTLVVVFALIGFWRPHWGVVVFLVLLPLESLLPDTLAGSAVFQSPLAAIGGAAVLGSALTLFLAGRMRPGAGAGACTMLGLLFIGWMFLSHPEIAWSGWDGRNWVFTFGQLWLLALVAGAALDSEDKHTVAMVAFTLACLVSAFAAITAAPTVGGSRAVGLGVGANAVARQYAVATVFAVFLSMRFTKVSWRVGSLIGAAILAIGVAFTESRAGLFMEALALVLVSVVSAQRKIVRTALNGLLVVMIVFWLIPQNTVESVLTRFAPNFDTAGAEADSIEANVRYKLWGAGLSMWRDNLMSGVGPGEFANQLPEYLPETKTYVYGNLTPHSLYVAILSQTGAIGLALFAAMMLAALIRAWRSVSDFGGRSPAAAWGLAFLVLALGATLKDESADKLTWLSMGVAAASVLRAPLPARRLVRQPSPSRPSTVIRAHR